MWANSWVLKDVFSIIFKMLIVGGAIYFGMYAFAKITYKIHKLRIK